jgi:hypothetical protein
VVAVRLDDVDVMERQLPEDNHADKSSSTTRLIGGGERCGFHRLTSEVKERGGGGAFFGLFA